MAKAVTKFVAASGASYDDEHEAWCDDLLTYFTSVTNEGIARQIVAHIDTPHGCDNLGTILAGLQTTRPRPVEKKSMRLSPDELRRLRLVAEPPVHILDRTRPPGLE